MRDQQGEAQQRRVNPYKAAARLGIAYLDLPILGRLFTHNPKVIGSNPIPATKEYAGQSRSFGAGSSVSQIAFPTFIPTTVYDCFYEGNQTQAA
jgi:hypothetical protein